MKPLSKNLTLFAIVALLASLPSCRLYMQQQINSLPPHTSLGSVGGLQSFLDGIKRGNKAMEGIHDKASADAAAPAVKASFAHMAASPEINQKESNWKMLKKIEAIGAQLKIDGPIWADNLTRLRDHRYYGSQSLKKAIPLDRITFYPENMTNLKKTLKE